jgi:hypothetical protein
MSFSLKGGEYLSHRGRIPFPQGENFLLEGKSLTTSYVLVYVFLFVI